MVAYSFQKRFVGHVQAGLEAGPWCPGMKRHTLRLPRTGRAGHARPEQQLQLYTGMRTRQCRLIGRAVARLLLPVTVIWQNGRLGLARRAGNEWTSRLDALAPVVLRLLDAPFEELWGAAMDDFARTDGFADARAMAAFFDPPPGSCPDAVHKEMFLIAWSPETR